jgi:hypothetical protein
MAASTIQLGGIVRVGTAAATPTYTDVSDYVTMVTATTSRNSITKSATYGNLFEDEKAGARKDSVTFQFVDDLGATAFRNILWDIMQTSASEMAFTVNFYDEATSVTNPRYSGTAVVLNLDTGGDVNSERSQSQTFPVLSPGLVKSTS